jgi:HPt (histidine-containing phosphotransfer) domain-containing protein
MAEIESKEFEMSVVANIAHKLKSSASTIGLDSLYHLTQTIEQHAKTGDKNSLLESMSELKGLLPKIEAVLDEAGDD